MSYILDALKRSDQERNRGHIPDIQSQPFNSGTPVRRKPTSGRWKWLGLAILVVIAVVVAYWQYEAAPPAAVAATAIPPQPAPQQVVMVEPQSKPAAPVPPKPEKEDAFQGLQGLQLKVAPVEQPVAVSEPPSTRQSTPLAPTPQPVEESGLSEVPQAAEQSTPPAPTETVAIAPASPSVSAEPDPYGDIPHQRQLPLELQRQLPELKVSVHIFAEQPASRMVRINDVTYREGDRVASQLELLEITPDGLILSFRKNRFWRPTH